ncbi:MAG: diguanylate cyclase [Pyrinomonadaceae bacterium]
MSSTAKAKMDEAAKARDRGRVLFVTDETLPPTFRVALESSGISVVGVAGGAAALVALRRTRPHVVVADERAKGIGAEGLARMLPQVEEGVPLILVGAAEATVERRAEAMFKGAFDYFQLPSDLRLLVARTAQLISIKQKMDALRGEADRDYLTGLANRRRFRLALNNEVERFRRYDVPCALLLIDIDHLKVINDAHGHSAGDVVIRRIGSEMTAASRDNDTAARLGGEEFALLLAGATGDKAFAAAERLRERVSSAPVEDVGVVTISIGVAACPLHAVTERNLYEASDAALYRAKREGRNRTLVAQVLGDR